MIASFLICYILSLIISVFTIFTGICVVFYPPFILRTFPRALRLYVTVCYIPLIILVALVTTYCSVISILFGDHARILFTINNVNSYIVQTIRTFFFIVALERIIATVYIEKYKFSHKFWWFSILTLFTVAFSVMLVAIVLNVSEGSNITFLLYRYTLLTMHVTSILVTAILYALNQRLYKITAYRISLKKRYQIVENVKILLNIFPLMLIYNLLSPIGTVITLIGFHFPLPSMPNGVLYILHNIPHLIIFLRIIYANRKRMKELNTVENEHEHIAVKTVMGKNLAVMINADEYFKGLQQQWK